MKKYKFDELYEMSSGISSKPEQAGHGAPFLSFSVVFNNYFLPNVLNDYMDTSEDIQKTYSIRKGDIFLTRTSEVIEELGISSVATKDYPNATYSGFLKRLRPIQDNKTYEKFMGFYLRSKMFRKTMTDNAVLTLRASLNEQIFSYLDLLLIDYKDQVKAGDFLYDLNSKIVLNNQINSYLEKMAKTLYDYWFVQFDFPDKNGRPYKSSGGKMVWNEKVKKVIPFGWEVDELGKIADIRRGELITENESKSGNIKVVAAGIKYSYLHSEYNRDKYTITVSGSGANAGYINFWREPIFASDCTTIRGSKNIDTIFIRHYLFLLQRYIFNLAKGSAQPHVYPSDIKNLYYIVPPPDQIRQVENLFLDINECISKNDVENQHLTELRNWLLPMLMNGQVKVT